MLNQLNLAFHIIVCQLRLINSIDDYHYWAIGGEQLAISNRSLAFHNTQQRDAYVTVEAAARVGY